MRCVGRNHVSTCGLPLTVAPPYCSAISEQQFYVCPAQAGHQPPLNESKDWPLLCESRSISSPLRVVGRLNPAHGNLGGLKIAHSFTSEAIHLPRPNIEATGLAEPQFLQRCANGLAHILRNISQVGSQVPKHLPP